MPRIVSADIASDAFMAPITGEPGAATSPGVVFSSTVVPIRLKLLPRHREHAARWLHLGQRMGLLDIAFEDDCAAIVVWVRESSEPAYVVRAERMDWVVVDYASERRLGAFRSFEAALNCIRPVLPESIPAA